jgi:DNA-binding IclR family transcriptional regulator
VNLLMVRGQAGAALDWLVGARGRFVTIPQIAAGAGVSGNTVRRVLAALDGSGWLDTESTTWPRGYQVRPEVRR